MDLAELGNKADELESIRARRIKADKVAAELKSQEYRLQTEIIEAMEQNDLSSVGGKSCVLNRSIKKRAYATDWNAFYRYVADNDAFDMLHKRLTDSAILSRLDDGETVPGVDFMEYSKITFAKART